MKPNAESFTALWAKVDIAVTLEGFQKLMGSAVSNL
tara:strand:- start:454 stop:561 length:108 start_codon:yes stop_codon:yes gene_type:complete